MDKELNAGQSFFMRRLPWVTGLIALLLFLLTLNHWLSFTNMLQVAKVSGFSWQLEAFNPIYFVVSLPLRLLPPQWAPLAVNFLAALCAALVIGLLTRAVILLPRDRTHQLREREKSEVGILSAGMAWLPPVFAASVCALQLTFWQHATNGTPDLVHLVLFAYVVRALLEYRVGGTDGWLVKAALAYGALMTSEWLATALFPAFVAALVWLKGLRFFKPRFLGRAALAGVIGLCLFFLLPVIAAMSPMDSASFWSTFMMNLGLEKTMVVKFPKKVLLLMFMTSLIPIIVCSIKWASYFGDTSKLGERLASSVMHVAHVVLLGISLWVMFDPNFSPRLMGFGQPFLMLYLLSALSVGYYSGYLLIVFRPILSRSRRTISGSSLLHRLANGLVMLLALLTPAGLLYKNLPVIHESNGPALVEYSRLTAENLPKSGYLLADDAPRALLIQMWLTRVGRAKDFVVVETWPLQSPEYNRHLKKLHGDRWPFGVGEKINPTDMSLTLDVLRLLAQAGDVYYLHPSFGIFFEHFYLEPLGLLYRLKPFEPDRLLPPPLAAPVLAQNEAFWKKAADEAFPVLIKTLARLDPANQPDLRSKLLKKLHLPDDPMEETRLAGSLFSRSLNYWGAEVQKAGDLEKAATLFEQARQINPDNVVAQANLEFNRNYRAGQRKPVSMPASPEDRFGSKARSWDQVLGANGPYEEPDLCYAQGFLLMQRGMIRQAAAAFERVHAFAPDDPPTRLWLAQLNLLARKPDRTLELTRDIVQNPARFELSETNRIDALSLMARGHLLRQEPVAAETVLEAAVKESPTNNYLLATVVGIYSESGLFSNALAIVERQLRINPTDASSLLNKGFCEIQLKNFGEAINTMTRLLTLTTNNPNALLNRAIAYLQNNQLEPAQQDYDTLLRDFPPARQVFYGLGEISYRRKDTNAAVRHYESYRSNSVPNSAEAKFVEDRLRELRGEPPDKKQ